MAHDSHETEMFSRARSRSYLAPGRPFASECIRLSSDDLPQPCSPTRRLTPGRKVSLRPFLKQRYSFLKTTRDNSGLVGSSGVEGRAGAPAALAFLRGRAARTVASGLPVALGADVVFPVVVMG